MSIKQIFKTNDNHYMSIASKDIAKTLMSRLLPLQIILNEQIFLGHFLFSISTNDIHNG
jgi:hypothetical protein